MAQLQHVAEQNQPLGSFERVEERRPQVRAAQQVDAILRAEVEVADDEGAQLSGRPRALREWPSAA
jgi:hypothetical protein